MRLDLLRVLHLKKGLKSETPYDLKEGLTTGLQASTWISKNLPDALFLDSCQRWLWVCSRTELEDVALPDVLGLEVFRGEEAYSFLLRVSTGLESQIPGETDIFGQLKEAWRRHSSDLDLAPLMQKIFEDTKDIRSRYLQNLGGASYGSLVRMLLKKGCPGPTLIVGAGQIAQSVAPYLMEGELWLSNRNPENLAALYADLSAIPHSEGMLRVVSPAEEAQAWAEAANVVVCIPLGDAKDAERIALRKQRSDGMVIHLGGLREQAGEWNQLPGFNALDDLFSLQKAQGDVRMTQVAQAARACEEKAKLRSLGASITIPHGWEDLAVFA